MRLWIPALLVAIALPAVVAPAHAESYTGTVSDVLDAATLVVTLNGQAQTVKLIGVAPARFGAIDWTVQGRDYARQLLLNRSVQLDMDTQPRDAQGRLLAWVFVGGVLANQELVRTGMAVAVPDSLNVRYAGNMVQAQQEATRNGAGVWNPRNHLPSPSPVPTPTPSWTPTPRPSFSATTPPSLRPSASPRVRHDHGRHLGQKKGKGHHKGHGKGHEHHDHEDHEHDDD
jgi:endonuclease YncB( thermonuclease family)